MPLWHARTGIGLLMQCFVLDFAVFSLRFEASEANDPIWQCFVYNCRHFCALVAIGRTTADGTRDNADQRKTTRTPHPFARDGSGIPVPRVYKMTCVIGSMRLYLRR